MKSVKQRIEDLNTMRDTQCLPGNADTSEYMRGLANGLILSSHIMSGEEGDPKFIPAPEVTLITE